MRGIKVFMASIAILTLFVTASFGFVLNESYGGTAVALGGIVLDKNMGGFNVIYNPTYIANSLSVTVTYKTNIVAGEMQIVSNVSIKVTNVDISGVPTTVTNTNLSAKERAALEAERVKKLALEKGSR